MSVDKRIVKQILSGDSLVLREKTRGDAPAEQTVLLAYIQAPKIGRSKDGKTSADEPLAWEAREFLREKLIGKEVRVQTEYTLNSAGRDLPCVSLYLDDNQQSINQSIVIAGLAELNRRKQNAETPEQQTLSQLEADAKAAGIGLWAAQKPQPIRQRVLNDISLDAAKKLVGQTLTGLVEHVKDGSSFKIGVFFPLNVPVEQRHDYQLLSVHLSGVKSPAVDQEFGEMARYFSETRLLNRQVQVHVEQVPNLNFVSIVGSVTMGERNIALFLLKEGLARTVDRSIGSVYGGIEPYRAAERAAKQANLRIWKSWTAPASFNSNGSSNGSANQWTGQVVEIVNAECILVERPGESEPVKVWLSSIRGPKADASKVAAAVSTAGSKDKPQPVRTRPLYEVPHLFEAREFLRRKLIGRPVRVDVDYVQPASNGLPERLCATVFASDINVAVALVLKGYATVIKRNDDQKSHAFDDLLEAEAKAVAAGKALYAKNQGKVKLLKPTDVSTDTSRASFHVESLTRGAAKEAIVEFVFSSTRFKLYLVKENLLINLVIGGIQSDKVGKDDVYLSVVRRLLQQRDVKVTVERVDKAGNFIGQLLFTDPQRIETSLSLYLLRQGWVKVRDDKNTIFLEAQREAQKAQRGIWVGWVDAESELNSSVATLNVSDSLNDSTDVKEESDAAASDLNALEKVVITFVDENPVRVSVQNFAGAMQLVYLQNELRNDYQLNPPHPGTFRGKEGDICSARYPEDKQWYRAKVERLNKAEREAQVVLIDYGDRVTVNTTDDLRNLPCAKTYGLSALPGVARMVNLAFVYLPKDEEWVEEVKQELEARLLKQSEFRLKPQLVNAGGSELVTLLADPSGEDIVLSMVREGYFCVNKRLVGKRRKHADADFEKYKAAQEQAMKARANLWRYGDVREDDDKQ